MRNLSIILYWLPVFFCLPGRAQHNNNWYFGRKAALDFNATGNQPVPFTVLNSAMSADEAAASISDEDGKLVFYTNGITVYNRLHEVMLNGDGLDGHLSACQISIVPMPGNNKLFYIFTTDALENDFQNGYRYSIVDMSGDNGKGVVVTKNVLLASSCTERLTAARHANGVDVWLITNDNNSNIFRAWLINCNGLQASPVVSTVGIVMDQFVWTNCGVLKVSPDGKQLCQTHFPYFDEAIAIPNFIQLFNFDNSTGIISNPRSITFPDANFRFCAFSSNSKLLYLTGLDKKIDQLEITLPTTTAIENSRISLPVTNNFFDIQLAPDDKIYISRISGPLTVINKPNVKGAGCNLQEEQVNLSPGSAYIGLPSSINDISSTDPENNFTYTILDSCSGTVQFHASTTMAPTLTWSWDFGDGNTSSVQDPIHVFTPSNQVYTVKLKVASSLACGVLQRSRSLLPRGFTGKVDFDFVVRCDSGYVRFNNKNASLQDDGGVFLWDFGDGNVSTDLNPIHTYNLPGDYPVKLKLITTTACLDDSLLQTVRIRAFTVMAPPDQTILVGQTVQLSANGPTGVYKWSPATWLTTSNGRSPIALPLENIVYKVTATNSDGCKSEDSVFIHVLQLDDFYVPTAFTPNNDGKNDVIMPFFGAAFKLNDFSIFNRWGRKVFSTAQRGAGWNGKINGLLQDTGVYVWIIHANDKSGVPFERKGSFVLIR